MTPPNDDPGPVVRPYALTGGRARPVTGTFDLIALVASAGERTVPAHGLAPEHLAILDLCRSVMSVAEVSAHLDLPVGTVRVLLGDLLVRKLVDIWPPTPRVATTEDRTLEAVLHGLRAL